MKQFLGAALAAYIVVGLGGPARADDKEATAILDKAIKALGGEEKLAKVKAAKWKTKGTIAFGGNDNPVTLETTVQGLDHIRSEFEGEFGDNTIKGVTILAGDKGWRQFGDNTMELDKEGVANEKRTVYLSVVPVAVLPLKGKEFKVAVAKEEKIGGKDAVGLKVTGPDGKDFTIHFDKESGLPVRVVAKVIGFMGEEFEQETAYGDYKEMDGIQKATKIDAKRDGEKFINQKLTEFKVLDKVDPKMFAEPK
jgi:hypothetical protein